MDYVTFLDLRKAFNPVDHCIILLHHLDRKIYYALVSKLSYGSHHRVEHNNQFSCRETNEGWNSSRKHLRTSTIPTLHEHITNC